MSPRPPARRRFALTSLALSVPLLLSVLPASPAAATTGPDRPAAAPTVELCPRVPGRFSCLAERVVSKTPAVTGVHPAATVPGFGPADLHSAYQVPASTTTQTVAIIDAYDSPAVEQDLAAYRAQFGLPACTTDNGCFRKVNQDGNASPLPAADTGWSGETALDTQMVSAVCPTCHILLVEANDDDRSGQPNLEYAVRQATTMGAKYVSMSWGAPEWANEQSADAAILSTPHVAYVAAAGDTDYGTSWPAANPNVVSVGGTSLAHANNARGWVESVWGYTNGTGTGSGCTTNEPRPSWQDIAPITSLCSNRAMNDVSVVADPHTGVSVYQGGKWFLYGGTSAGAPMIAAMYAMVGSTSDAPASAYPYLHSGSFNDVTSNGNANCGNALCTAQPGWDGPSGWGTPNGLGGFSPTVSNTVTVHNPATVTGFAGSGVAVDTTATDSGGLALSYTANGLPTGTWVRSDGVIVGAPQRAGTFWVTVDAWDATGAQGSTGFWWQVAQHRIATSYTPRITGALRRGHTVYAAWGAFRQDSRWGPVIRPSTWIQWYVDGHAIRGANHWWFTIPRNYRGHRLQFAVYAWANYYTTYGYSTPRSARIG